MAAIAPEGAPTMSAPAEDFMLKLYGMTGSGNCYKPALLMRRLGVPFQWVETDILHGASRTPEFLARSDDRWPRAQVLQWLFFEQYSHEPYIATVRFWVHYLHKQDEWSLHARRPPGRLRAGFLPGRTPLARARRSRAPVRADGGGCRRLSAQAA